MRVTNMWFKAESRVCFLIASAVGAISLIFAKRDHHEKTCLDSANGLIITELMVVTRPLPVRTDTIKPVPGERQGTGIWRLCGLGEDFDRRTIFHTTSSAMLIWVECWGDQTIFQVGGWRSEFDAGGDDAAQFVGACLSSYPEIIAHEHRLGWEWGNPICPPGGDVARFAVVRSGWGIGFSRMGFMALDKTCIRNIIQLTLFSE